MQKSTIQNQIIVIQYYQPIKLVGNKINSGQGEIPDRG